MEKIYNYIDGVFQLPRSNEFIENFNPSTGKVYSLIPDSDARDIEDATQAALKAFPVWSAYNAEQRAYFLNEIAKLIEKNQDLLAFAESKDNGKPLKLAKSVDIPRARDNFAFFASAIKHFDSESHFTKQGVINYTLRKPIGVAGCISPWNLPLYLFTWKIAPALAAGNTVVAKPSEITPMTAYLLSKICIEAGLPKGVLNIVHGLGSKTGQAISENPSIKMISFTGGTETGKTIAKTAAPMFKKLSLELGGKNPNIIFDDANFDVAVSTSVKAAFSNQGQICLCGSRIFIQKPIYEKFKTAFVSKTKNLKIAPPLHQDSQIGAIVSKQHFRKILNYIELGKEEGGTLLAGGKEVKMAGEYANGWYIEPTVFENLSFDCRVNMEEIFGPVVTLTPFETKEEVLEMANATEYGLSATVFTTNINTAHQMADELKAGIVWINTWLLRDLRTPFGGMKNSGVGREGGWEALKFFTEPKNVCIQY